MRGARPYLDISTDIDPKHLRERLSSPDLPPLFRAMKIDHFKAVWHVPVKGGPSEQFVDLDCGVSLDLSEHRVYRRACERRRYGVVFVSPPKPFDQMTLAIADHGFLRELPRIRSVFRRRLLASNALSERMAWVRQARSGGNAAAELTGTAQVDGDDVVLTFAAPLLAARRPPSMPAQLRAVLAERLADRRNHDREVDDRLAKMSLDERGWEEWRMVLDQPAAQINLRIPLAAAEAIVAGPGAAGGPAVPGVAGARANGAAWPRLPPTLIGTDAPTPDSVIFSLAPELDLAEFDYESRLHDAEREQEGPLEQSMEQANDLWVPLMSTAPISISGGDLAELEKQLQALHAKMRPAFVKLANLLEDLVQHSGRHSRTGLTGGALEAYLVRSSHRLRAFGLHVETQAELKAAVASFPVFNGHLSLTGTHPLELDLPKLEGKCVISVKTSRAETAERLTVRQIVRPENNQALAVIDAPTVELAGKVEASVVVGERLALRRPAEIVGNLIIKKFYPLKDRPADEMLRGTVKYDARLYSGPILERKVATDEPENFALDHLIVTLCPRGVQRTVRRAPPAGENP